MGKHVHAITERRSKVPDHLELELQVVLSHLIWKLGTDLRSPESAGP